MSLLLITTLLQMSARIPSVADVTLLAHTRPSENSSPIPVSVFVMELPSISTLVVQLPRIPVWTS